MEIKALQHEVEAISEFYAQRFDIPRTDDWLVLKLGEEVGELTQAYLAKTQQSRDKGRTAEERDADFGAELADVLAHVLLIAERFEVDLPVEITNKWLAWKEIMPDPK